MSTTSSLSLINDNFVVLQLQLLWQLESAYVKLCMLHASSALALPLASFLFLLLLFSFLSRSAAVTDSHLELSQKPRK